MNLEMEPNDVITLVWENISEMEAVLTFNDKGTDIPVTVWLKREHVKYLKETLENFDF